MHIYFYSKILNDELCIMEYSLWITHSESWMANKTKIPHLVLHHVVDPWSVARIALATMSLCYTVHSIIKKTHWNTIFPSRKNHRVQSRYRSGKQKVKQGQTVKPSTWRRLDTGPGSSTRSPGCGRSSRRSPGLVVRGSGRGTAGSRAGPGRTPHGSCGSSPG